MTPKFMPIEGALEVEKDLVKFLNRQINAVRLEVVIVRESLPNGVEHLLIRPACEEHKDLLVTESWVNPKKPKASEQPKHTGGKKPYIMLMVSEVEKLRGQGVKNVEELIGYLVCLGKYIEWNTGRLVRKRSKKPLKYADLQKIFPCGNRKLNKILAELKEHDLLFGTKEGYFISTRLIKKGKTKNKEGR